MASTCCLQFVPKLSYACCTVLLAWLLQSLQCQVKDQDKQNNCIYSYNRHNIPAQGTTLARHSRIVNTASCCDEDYSMQNLHDHDWQPKLTFEMSVILLGTHRHSLCSVTNWTSSMRNEDGDKLHCCANLLYPKLSNFLRNFPAPLNCQEACPKRFAGDSLSVSSYFCPNTAPRYPFHLRELCQLLTSSSFLPLWVLHITSRPQQLVLFSGLHCSASYDFLLKSHRRVLRIDLNSNRRGIFLWGNESVSKAKCLSWFKVECV